MATEKLFEQDVYLSAFTARVLTCEAGKHGYHVCLDRTAFYPEGGGQPADRGTLDGIAVEDVHTENGEIVHYLKEPLEVGRTVTGKIDFDRRRSLMQLHSGEHIVSGLIFARYGYHNVGFHMGRDAVTIDFDGPIPPQALEEVEWAANRVIWENRPVRVFWPTAEELPRLPYRSKKPIEGAVRLVEFEGVDLCACCGTHVTHTGEVGVIKLLTCQKFHEGVRIEMLAGAPAFAYLSQVMGQNRAVSAALSAKPLETAQAVARLSQELENTKLRAARAEEQCFSLRASALAGAGDVLLFEEGLRPDGVRRLCDAVKARCGGRCAVFSPAEEGYSYAIAQSGGNLKALTAALNAALNGRGGGRPDFVQGSVRADRAAIEAFFREVAP